jgi:hypothetical protein
MLRWAATETVFIALAKHVDTTRVEWVDVGVRDYSAVSGNAVACVQVVSVLQSGHTRDDFASAFLWKPPPPTERCRADPNNSRHFTNVRSGLPFSTTYVASSLAVPLPTFFAAWIVPAGMKRTSPALSVIGGLPSI